VVLPYLSYVENRACLSCGVEVIGATWRVVTRIMARVEDLMQRTEDGQPQVGYSVAERSRGRLTLCTVCTVHMEMESVSFLVAPQNQG
jgi:hypothetical protein